MASAVAWHPSRIAFNQASSSRIGDRRAAGRGGVHHSYRRAVQLYDRSTSPHATHSTRYARTLEAIRSRRHARDLLEGGVLRRYVCVPNVHALLVSSSTEASHQLSRSTSCAMLMRQSALRQAASGLARGFSRKQHVKVKIRSLLTSIFPPPRPLLPLRRRRRSFWLIRQNIVLHT